MIEPVLLARVLTDLLKRHPDASLSRWLLYEVGVRRGTINRPPTKVDRIWRAGASAATAAVCLGIAVGAIGLTERVPNFSTSSYVLTGIEVEKLGTRSVRPMAPTAIPRQTAAVAADAPARHIRSTFVGGLLIVPRRTPTS